MPFQKEAAFCDEAKRTCACEQDRKFTTLRILYFPLRNSPALMLNMPREKGGVLRLV